MKKYAVLGNPIAHSKSPEIHQAFAKQFNIALSYERILVSLGGLAAALHDFQRQGGSGVNVTLPFKEEAFTLVQKITDRALQTEVVNTITFDGNNELVGDNTDGVGLYVDLTINNQIVIKGKRIAILGAGGAVKGILGALLLEEPEKITIINRTVSKAEELVHKYSTFSNLEVCSLANLVTRKFDLIINATSASTKGETFALAGEIAKDAICYDLAYGENAKQFLRWAQQNGAILCLDGLGMLVEQAAEAFYVWHGKRPKTSSLIEQLRE